MLALPAGAWMAQYHAFAQAHRGKVKITAVKAMQVKNIAGNCLIKIETDAGLIGYGEAGSSGPMARSRINSADNINKFRIENVDLRKRY